MELPTCALLNNRGTVIVRLKDAEKCEGCRKPEAYRLQCRHDYSYSLCELCLRTGRKCSDCDSAPYDKCRPYRTKAFTNRFVKVCAAVCVLLFVGSVCPQAAAAPRRTPRPTMEHDQDMRPEDFWENPCDYKQFNVQSSSRKYSPKQAKDAATIARNTLNSTLEYKDLFANTTNGYAKYEDLIAMWDTYDWLRRFPWYTEEMLPRDATFNNQICDDILTSFVDSPKLNTLLPNMYKTLQVVVASLDAMARNGLTEGYLAELKTKIVNTNHKVRAVLCNFYDILISRNLQVENVKLTNEVPDFGRSPSDMILVYRDTLDYLNYLAQVFQKMYKDNV